MFVFVLFECGGADNCEFHWIELNCKFHDSDEEIICTKYNTRWYRIQ